MPTKIYVNFAKHRKAGKDLKIQNDPRTTQVEKDKAGKRRAKYEEGMLKGITRRP